MVAAAIDVVEASGVQIDDGATATDEIHIILHIYVAQSGEVTAAIEIESRKAVSFFGLSILDEDIALFLHGVVHHGMASEALAASEDGAVNRVVGIIDRLEVDEGVVVQVREEESRLGGTLIVCVLLVEAVSIVVGAIVAAEDALSHVALQVPDIGGCRRYHFVRCYRGDVAEVTAALDGATEVVAAIDNVAYPGEHILSVASATIGLTSDVNLRMSQDVGIGRAAEGIVDTSVAQVDVGAAADESFVAAAIEILGLGQVHYGAIVVCSSC